MDIEDFYDADPRRRDSAEVELGDEWRDVHGVRYELSWIEDTGELYVMREPPLDRWPDMWATPFGGVHLRGVHVHGGHIDEHEIQGMTVSVIATIPARQEVEDMLSGWETAMEQPASVEWLVDRLREHGLLAAAPD